MTTATPTTETKTEVKMNRPGAPEPSPAIATAAQIVANQKPLTRGQVAIQNLLKNSIPKPPTERLKYKKVEYFIKRLSFPELQAIFALALIKSGLDELDVRNPQAWQALVSATLFIDVASDEAGKAPLFESYDQAHELASHPDNIAFVNALFEACTKLNPDILK